MQFKVVAKKPKMTYVQHTIPGDEFRTKRDGHHYLRLSNGFVNMTSLLFFQTLDEEEVEIVKTTGITRVQYAR